MYPNQRSYILAISLCAAIPNLATALVVSGQGTWETTLQGRDLDGDLATFEAYYDTVLDITWLADGFYGKTSGPYAYGIMTWSSANAWATNLNPYGSGITGWRLPAVSPIDGTTADDGTTSSNIGTEDIGANLSAPGTLYAGSTASEMAHLFYNSLGNKSYCDPTTSTASLCSGPQSGSDQTNTGPFSNVYPAFYWSATEFAPDTRSAWVFHLEGGEQIYGSKFDMHDAWAVHTGDVGTSALSVVPLPASLWIFGSGLLGLMGFLRKSTK